MFCKSDVELINKMRQQGTGYKKIANAIGSTRDKVRSYCLKYCMGGDGSFVSENVESLKAENIICANCGNKLRHKKRGRSRRFCSEECRRNWWSENQHKRNKSQAANYKCVCANCNMEFGSYGNKKRKYCSHACYIKSRFWKGDEDGI